MNNNSPWLYELSSRTDFPPISHGNNHDIVIIGAGISGITTAYQILTQTNRNVTLVDGRKICRGATGHNAGQLVAEFELSYKDLVEAFGIFMAKEAEQSLDGSWDILNDIFKTTNLPVQKQFFMGVDIYGTQEDLYDLLEEEVLRKQTGLLCEDMYVLPEIYHATDFPRQYKSVVNVMERSDMLSLIGENNDIFIAVQLKKKGVMNSALFGEQLIVWLLDNFSNRFSVHEHSMIETIHIDPSQITITFVGNIIIKTNDVILCTNGFENFTITQNHTNTVNTILHHHVAGIIGYMGASHSREKSPPMAQVYYNSSIISEDEESEELEYLKHESKNSWTSLNEEPYIYITKRDYSYQDKEGTLVCIGGPQKRIADTTAYDEERNGSDEFYDVIEEVKNDMLHIKDSTVFTWHGLMGVTPTSIRIVGQEPRAKNLWYNLGCNGIGIMPAIYGSWKIGQILTGKHFPPSVFDPQ